MHSRDCMAMKEGMRDSPPSSVEGDSIKRADGCARDVFPHVPSFPVISSGPPSYSIHPYYLSYTAMLYLALPITYTPLPVTQLTHPSRSSSPCSTKEPAPFP